MEKLIKIMIIDDDEVDRMIIKRSLQSSEYTTEFTEYENAEEALNALYDQNYTCVFLDYMLPDMDGLEVLKRLKLQDNKVPVIVVTSHGDEQIAVEMMKYGATDYVVKNQINRSLVEKMLQNIKKLHQYRKEKEDAIEALRRSEARLAEAQRIAQMGSWEYDMACDKLHFSQEMFRLMQIDESEVNLSSREFIRKYVHDDDRKRIRKGIDESLEGKPFNKDIRIQMPDKSYKYCNAQAYFLCDASGNYHKYVGTLQDIHHRKVVERELKQAKLKAEESGKIKEQFLANMSHEIRTPINAIVGFTQLLSENEANHLTETGKKYTRNIQSAAQNLLKIINDILDITKLHSNQFELEYSPLSIPDLSQEIHDMFSLLKNDQVELNFSVDSNIPEKLLGDSIRLGQILTNLLSNAFKFTKKGSVNFNVSLLKASNKKALVRFEVSDTGIGIPKDKQKEIFQKFTQASADTTRKYGGTGLGLAIVKQIVTVLNGDIKLESEPGKGSRFFIDIPFKKANQSENEVRLVSQNDVADQLPKIKLLMAEDNPLNQELVKAIIADLPWEMDLANNGLEAIKLIEKNSYDLILLDIQMPEKDGYEVSRHIRNHKSPEISTLPVIAITAHALSDQLQECYDAGMNDRLSKPFTREDLIDKAIKVLKEKKSSYQKQKEETNRAKQETIDPDAFDMERLKVLANNNPEIMHKIIDIFLSEVPYEFNELIALNRNENWVELASACHKLKSSYSIIGAMQIHQKLNLIEEKCHDKKFDSVQFHGILKEAEKMHFQLIDRLQKYKLADTGS